LFRLMGKTDIAVLDGGFPKWQAEGRTIEDLPPIVRDRHMTVTRQNQMVKDVTQVASASKLGDYVIVDARAPERFRGDAPEPREGLRSGHIPNARNVFYRDLLAPDGTLKPNDAMAEVFLKAGVDLSKPAILSCGSGVTASVLALAMERMGKFDHAIYDGSWSEWGTFHDLPIATGDA
jgi:thiosulfate/3-mercaptopyruvate sulfurtransferase